MTIPGLITGRRYGGFTMGQSLAEEARGSARGGRARVALLAEVAAPVTRRRATPRARAGWPVLLGAALAAFLAGAAVGAVSNWFDAYRLVFVAVLAALLAGWLVPIARAVGRRHPPAWRELGPLGALLALALILAAVGWVTVGVLVALAACFHRYRRRGRVQVKASSRRRRPYRPKAFAMDTDRPLRPTGGTPSRSSAVRSSE
jgi:MFS family permease